MMYLNHITLSTGHTARTSRADVTGNTIKTLRPWLEKAIAHDGAYPLPGPLGSRDGFSMVANVLHGGLICHLNHADHGPLASFGIAARSRQSGELWAWMCAQYGSLNALTAPSTPWCAVSLHEGLMALGPDAGWIGDFERCVAGTWLERIK